MHGMFYSSQPVELRAFLGDKLGFPATDVGGGWLIFDMPDAELGVHPTDYPESPPSGTHNLSFYCDDIYATVADLKDRGVKFDSEVIDQGYGLVTHFTMPGGVKADLYQPKYARNPR